MNPCLIMEDQNFEKALAALEKALESPWIPGELESWAQEVLTQTEAFEPLLAQRMAARHEDLFGEIEQNDAELMRRVELMRGEDERIRAEFTEVLSRAARLAGKAGAIEPDERAVSDGVERFADEALALVIAIRKQELAVSTWLVESVARDRGPKD